MGPLVTPADPNASNATVVGDAMRKGFITAEEVVDRIGQRAQAKNAADIAQSQAAVPVAQAQAMAAQEAMSPQAQAMRSQQMQNTAMMDDLKMRALKYDVISKPNQLEPKLALLVGKGIQPPAFGPEGPSTDDINTINKLVGDVMEYDQSVGVAKEIAQKHFQPQLEETEHFSADGSSKKVVSPVYNTPLGKLDENQFKNAVKHSQQSFASWLVGPKQSAQQAIFGAPGQFSGASTPASAEALPAPISEEQTNRNRAALVERGGMLIEDVQKLTPEQINSLVQPAVQKLTAPLSELVIEPTLPPGGRVSMIKEAPNRMLHQRPPTEKEVSAATAYPRMEIGEVAINNLAKRGYDFASPSNIALEQLSVLATKVPVIGGFLRTPIPDDVKEAVNVKSGWAQGLLRLESGAAISRHEESWYASVLFPQPGDAPQTVQQKTLLRKEIMGVIFKIANSRVGSEEEQAALQEASRLNIEGKLAASRAGTQSAPVAPGQPIRIQAGGGQYNARKLPDGTFIYSTAQ